MMPVMVFHMVLTFTFFGLISTHCDSNYVENSVDLFGNIGGGVIKPASVIQKDQLYAITR